MAESIQERRVWQIVGGRFVPDSVGPDEYDRIVATVRADPAGHISAFERLFLTGRPNARNIVQLNLPNFLALMAPVAPREVTRLAKRLQELMGSLVQMGEAELEEGIDAERADELARRRSRIDMHNFNLAQLTRGS